MYSSSNVSLHWAFNIWGGDCGVMGSTLAFESTVQEFKLQAPLLFTSLGISLHQAKITGIVLTEQQSKKRFDYYCFCLLFPIIICYINLKLTVYSYSNFYLFNVGKLCLSRGNLHDWWLENML